MGRRIYRFLRILFFTRKIKFSIYFSKLNGSTNQYYIDNFEIVDSKLIHIPSSNYLLLKNCSFFNFNLNSIFFAFTNFSFSNQQTESFVIQKSIYNYDIRVLIRSKEDYELFYEIYILKPYSFTTNIKCNVVDVGMNVGYASLFFSSFPNVNKVYSFELVEETFQRAVENFSLNVDLTDKIIAHPFGLSTEDNEFAIPFAQPGSVGASIINNLTLENNSENRSSVVKVKDIIQVFTKILERDQIPLIVKFDCEGSEYDLIDAIDSASLFKHIHIIMIEWHNKGSESIVKCLSNNGFVVFDNLVPAHMPIGFIYAVNLNVINV